MKFVPRLLSGDQRANCLDVRCEMKDQLKTDPDFLSKIITGDEPWCYRYDLEKKQQSSQWKSASSPRPKKARQVKSNVKTILICFFDIKGLAHFEFHKVRLLTSSFTLKCSSNCMMLGEENAPNCGGQVSGFCNRTMLLPTQH